MTVCPAHRTSLGIGWTRRVPDKCKVPSILSHHSEDISKKPKADRGLSKAASYAVLQETGVFGQVYGIHKLMLMRPEREHLKDKHTYFRIVSLYFRDW